MTLLLGAFFAVPAFAISESEVAAEVAASGKETVVGNVLIWFLCAVAFLKVSQKIDSFMASLGVNVGHTGGSLMAEALIATRGIAMVAGMAGHAIGGVGRRSSGGTASGNSGVQGVGGYFKGGLAGMASRHAANNAVKTATNNTTIPTPRTSAAQAARNAAHSSTQGAQGPIPVQASTLAQAPRLTDQDKAAPTFHQSATPRNGAIPQPTHLTPPNEPAPVGSGAVPVPVEPDEQEQQEQHPIVLTDGASPIGSASGSMADTNPDFSPTGGDAVINNSEQSATLTEQQTALQGGSPGIIQTATLSSSQISEKSSAQSSNRTSERSSTSNNASRSTHTSSKLVPPVGNSFKSYGIGGAMFMKSLTSGGSFANDVIGRVAQGDIQTTGTISGEMATQALNSYMGITALDEGTGSNPTYSNVEIGGGRISGVETAPGRKEGVQFCMYHTEQYAAPQGEHTKVVTADGATWYKQYAQDSVDRKPEYAPDGKVAYNETIVKRMPNPPQRKSRL